MKRQTGFTLIELITVIVILGVLAVVALPRYVDLQDEAERAAAEGVAGALSAAFAINYAAYVASDDPNEWTTVASDLTGVPDPTAAPWSAILQAPQGLSDFQVGESENCDVGDGGEADGDSVVCELLDANGNSFTPAVTFTAILVDV